MSAGWRVNWGRMGWAVVAQTVVLLLATIVVFVLERVAGVRQASAVYLLAVAAIAVLVGSAAAAGTAIGAFLIYNFLFIPPLYTFTVGEPSSILNLFLLLVVGVLIGRLAGLQRDRAREAARREREARALFAITRSLAGARRAGDALPTVVDRLRQETRMSRVWVGLGSTEAREQVVSDSAKGDLPRPAQRFVLHRTPDEGKASWVRIMSTGRVTDAQANDHLYRVVLSDGIDEIGSLWASRPARAAPPSPEESRLLASAADSIGQTILREKLAGQANELEIARRSDELKSALLDSVSHDLRTPLATIRAAAGSLADPEMQWDDGERAKAARQIDAEAQRLNRIVGNLLDMGRIHGGALHAELETLPTGEVLTEAVERSRGVIGDRQLILEVEPDTPPVQADPLMLDEVLANLLENAGRYTPPGTQIRVAARAMAPGQVEIKVEDAGTGVPADDFQKIFDRFYRNPASAGRSGRGTGLGLAVVKGMVEAMAGQVSAQRSSLGGLAIVIALAAASPLANVTASRTGEG